MKLYIVIAVITASCKGLLGNNCNCGYIPLESPVKPDKDITVYYQGEGCECEKNLPYELEIPDASNTNPHASQTYGYNVDLIVLPKDKSCTKNVYDTQIEIPEQVDNKYTPLEGLTATADRVLLQKEECHTPTKKNHQHHLDNPIIETLGDYALSWPIRDTRDLQEPNVLDLRSTNLKNYCSSPDLILTRRKRDINGFSYLSAPYVYASQIEPPSTLKSKILTKSKGILNNIKSKRNLIDFNKFKFGDINNQKLSIGSIQPGNLFLKRNRRSVGVESNKKQAKISVKNTNHLRSRPKAYQKRSCAEDLMYPTARNVQKHSDIQQTNEEILQHLPEINSESNLCGKCNKLNQEIDGIECNLQCTCTPKIGSTKHRPKYKEYSSDGQQQIYVPGTFQSIPLNQYPDTSKPRIVFDQFGHRYIENNGKLRLIPPEFVGDAASEFSQNNVNEEQIYFNKIRDILYNHPDFRQWNSYNKPGEIAPSVADQTRNTIELLRDIVKNRHNDAGNIPLNGENLQSDVGNNYLGSPKPNDDDVEGFSYNIKTAKEVKDVDTLIDQVFRN